MHWETLIDAAALRAVLDDPLLTVVDCRFDLADTDRGERAWRDGHIPGAHYAHLDRDLSDLGRRGRGRHPLPDAGAFCTSLARWGITPAHQVVAYDDNGGMVAARLWWMLRLLGHRAVAVLDGGIAAWQAAGGALSQAAPVVGGGRYEGAFDAQMIASAQELEADPTHHDNLLLDARAGERFRGEVEPLDPRAGHIPGARNRPFMQNLEADGRFQPREVLAAQFHALLGDQSPAAVVHMCGSGVSACHNLLAMHHAGLTGSRVYAGSWSEWVSVPERAVATGPQ